MTDLTETACLAALEEHGSFRAAAAAMGIPASTLQNRVAKARRQVARGIVSNPPLPPAAVPPAGMVIARAGATFDGEGKLRSQTIATKRDAGEVFEPIAGQIVKGESVLLDLDGRVLTRWIKTGADRSDAPGLAEGLRDAFANFDGKAPAILSPKAADEDLLTVYPLADLHFGMFSWGKETGDNYDLKIATDIATRTVGDLVSQSRPSKRAVVLGLGDYFHSNDQTNATPANKHRLDTEGRWPKVYAAGAKLATTLINLVAAKHEEVEVVWLPGNHDPDAAVTLTVALSLFYSAQSRIRVYQEPTITWFRQHGKVLLGATHGHTMKPERMAMVMAEDCAEAWGKTQYRHIMFGHIHHRTMIEVGSVKCESFSTLAAKDGYAYQHGYRSGRGMDAITFHREHGEIGRHRVNIPVGRVSLA